MAIKAAFAAALLVALLALAGATTFTTTVTTTEEDSNPFQGQCHEMMQGRQFRACQRYLMQRGGPYGNELVDVIERQGGYGQQGSSMQECCQQLMQMDRQGCGCQAIRRAVMEVQQRPGQQVYQKAQMLPQMCNMREQQCQFPVVFL